MITINNKNIVSWYHKHSFIANANHNQQKWGTTPTFLWAIPAMELAAAVILGNGQQQFRTNYKLPVDQEFLKLTVNWKIGLI